MGLGGRRWACWVLGVRFVSGLFGVGVGWVLTPLFNLVMELPLKVAVACTEATIALGGMSAVWVYLLVASRLDFLASVQVGIAFGAFLGARVASRVRARMLGLRF